MSENTRVISLVPSWTETLIAAGVNVVGRTQFCIYPADKISSIQTVGGTKQLQIEKIVSLKPDLVILDQQENKIEMAKLLIENGIDFISSNVEGFRSCALFLKKIGQRLKNEQLTHYGERYLTIAGFLKPNLSLISKTKFWQNALIDGDAQIPETLIEYVIWRKPFMVIGQETFIAENLRLAGVELKRNQKYPELSEDELKKAFCLFSTEPYPFAEHFSKMMTEGFRGKLIDGEKISWYGIRNLNFLESCFEVES